MLNTQAIFYVKVYVKVFCILFKLTYFTLRYFTNLFYDFFLNEGIWSW